MDEDDGAIESVDDVRALILETALKLGEDYRRAMDEGRPLDAALFEARIDELERLLAEIDSRLDPAPQ